MPVKRWTKPPSSSAVTATSGATVVNAPLSQFIVSQILGNNCLGLPEDEVGGMARELMGLRTRPEVFEWANTLMMGEAFAAEIIKQREDQGPPFEGETVRRAMAPTPSLQATSMSVKKKKTKPKRTDINRLPQKAAPDAALKPGQFECGCFGTVHNVRLNCANCGRIVCEQESPDACYFCGMEPARCIAYEISVQEGKVSDAALAKDKESYEAAITKRDKLLEYAENRAKRTTVIDDQAATLFSVKNVWMSPQERHQAQKDAASEENRRRVEMMHRERGVYQVHIDFVNKNVELGSVEADAGVARTSGAGRSGAAQQSRSGHPDVGEADVLRSDSDAAEGSSDENEETPPQEMYGAAPLPSLLKQIWYSPDGAATDGTQMRKTEASSGASPLGTGASRRVQEVSRRVQQDYFSDDVDLFVAEAHASGLGDHEFTFDPEHPHYERVGGEDDDDTVQPEDAAGTTNVGASAPTNTAAKPNDRFAVTPVMRLRDEGVCLSMHQPWASLLVAGIKTHEGRVWGSEYRGRLWIHAAAHEGADIQKIEDHYRQFVPPQHPFPAHYPTRVLLGYVYVTDVLDEEAYQKAFSPEERQEGSPYSFICKEPKMLPFPLPMTGDHKLFKLEHKVLTAAKRQLGEIDV